jgi:hypothetical protein
MNNSEAQKSNIYSHFRRDLIFLVFSHAIPNYRIIDFSFYSFYKVIKEEKYVQNRSN